MLNTTASDLRDLYLEETTIGTLIPVTDLHTTGATIATPAEIDAAIAAYIAENPGRAQLIPHGADTLFVIDY